MKQKKSRRASTRDRIEITFLESVLIRCPGDRATMKALGDLYTRVGRIDDGLALDLALSRCCPDDPVVWYNLACSHALSGGIEPALDALARAIELGYADVKWMQEDGDLANLHGDPRFKGLCARLTGSEKK